MESSNPVIKYYSKPDPDTIPVFRGSGPLFSSLVKGVKPVAKFILSQAAKKYLPTGIGNIASNLIQGAGRKYQVGSGVIRRRRRVAAFAPTKSNNKNRKVVRGAGAVKKPQNRRAQPRNRRAQRGGGKTKKGQVSKRKPRRGVRRKQGARNPRRRLYSVSSTGPLDKLDIFSTPYSKY